MALETLIAGANTVLKTLSNQTGGLARVHENAPEALNELPATVIVPDEGDLDWPRKPSQRQTTHNTVLSLYVSRSDLPSADQALKPWVDKIVDLFDQNITLGGTTFNAGIVKYKYGHMEYAGTSYLGVTFTLRAVELVTLVYHG